MAEGRKELDRPDAAWGADGGGSRGGVMRRRGPTCRQRETLPDAEDGTWDATLSGVGLQSLWPAAMGECCICVATSAVHGHALNSSMLLSAGGENNCDSLSNGE